ncbi:MAG: hypothetical protein GF353_15395 [Candidatus Lokiarchaeota archaeon]|nr:hypothetical protein [Candidatus Lokiarchaeota archaeon]
MIFDETTNQLKEVGWVGKLNTKGVREILGGNLRYCLQGSIFYLPKNQEIIKNRHRLSWGISRRENFDFDPWLHQFDKEITVGINELENYGLFLGMHYSRRHLEFENDRIAAKEYCSQNMIDAIAKNQDALYDLSKRDFEKLMAEIFARMGFEVELYRCAKDDGIDFLAINIDKKDPIITCVQCKHPDRNSKHSLSVATVREIYGVTKCFDFDNCLTITSSTYSPDARKFASKKSEEIKLADKDKVLEWIHKYRWNKDE